MRWTVVAFVGLTAAGPGWAADAKRLVLKDEGLPLQVMRPNDRRAWILTLDGTWKEAPTGGTVHYINLIFPNGQAYSHKVMDDGLFRKGDVRCLIQDYQLARGCIDKEGKFTIVISAGAPVTSAKADEAVSEPLEVKWPLDRPLVKRPVRTRHMDPEPPDAFPLPPESGPKPSAKKAGS